MNYRSRPELKSTSSSSLQSNGLTFVPLPDALLAPSSEEDDPLSRALQLKSPGVTTTEGEDEEEGDGDSVDPRMRRQSDRNSNDYLIGGRQDWQMKYARNIAAKRSRNLIAKKFISYS